MPPCGRIARLSHSALLALGAGCSLSAFSCADGAEQRLDLEVIAGCEAESYSACAIVDAACQEEIFRSVSCLRQMPDAARPSIRVITRAEYEAELAAPAPSGESPGDAADPAAETESTPADASDPRVAHALELLGLAQPDDFSTDSFVALYSESVPGFYSNDEQIITVVDQGDERLSTDGDDTLLLAHEYLHALQDQDVDLDSLQVERSSFDRFMATLAVVEGEATMFEAFYAAAMWRLEGEIDFDSHFMSWIADFEEYYEAESPLLVGPRYFPYSFGARYVYGLYAEGGVPAVRGIYASMPASVVGMLGGGFEGASAESLEALPVPAAAGDYEVFAQDSLGPWVFGKFLQRSLSQFAFEQIAQHWRGDRLFVYARGEAVTAIWAVQLDTLNVARQYSAMLSGGGNVNLSPSAFSVNSGRNVAVGVTDEPAASATWAANVSAAQEAFPQDAGSASAAAPRISPLLRRRLVSYLSRLR